MKIGILTFHRADNYGAVLQCYALQTFLRQQGHDAYVLDYRQPYLEYMYHSSVFRQILSQLKNSKKIDLERILIKKNINSCFQSFRDKFLYVDNRKFCKYNRIPTDYDAYLIGSDQVWSYSVCGNVVDPVYWGDFCRLVKGKVISFAASSAVEKFKSWGEEDIREKLQNFNSISVREPVLKDYLQNFTDKDITVLSDPTLLLDNDSWSVIADSSKLQLPPKYILLYSVRDYNNYNQLVKEKAEHLSQKMEVPLIEMGRSYIYSPEDFLKLIKHATFFITSSFHGTVFANIFRINYSTIAYGDGNDARYTNLLDRLNMNHCLHGIHENVDFANINYLDIDEKLNLFKLQAQTFVNISIK